MNEEMIARMTNEINAAIKDGYFPVEDLLNGPKTRIIPDKLRRYLNMGETEFHMASDIRGKEPFSIYANEKE